MALHEKKDFCLTKICEKDRKDHFFVSFRMFPFHGNIFSELSFKRKCKKAASFRRCVFLRKYDVKMKFSVSHCNENKRFFASVWVNFSLTIFKRKDEIFCCITAKNKPLVTFLLKMFIFFQ